MIHSRKEREKLEADTLAPYAARSGDSRGRLYAGKPHPYRTDFQRDRDRIIYSRAFRRLEYKTQVFINGIADHYRTRLTHTMEMAAIGRTLARVLRANEDLTEAIALAHDIGHSPFGHCGERALNDIMKEHGGFDHNLQSLRWVEWLEDRYPDFPGLNLTWEVRAGLRKHIAADPGAELDGHPIGPFQCIEAQIADVADDIAYQSHDIEDGLAAGLLTREKLEELELWRIASERAAEHHPDITPDQRTHATIRFLLDYQVEDVIRTSEAQLQRFNPRSPGDVMNAPERIIRFSAELKERLKPFREFLFNSLYWHPSVDDANRAAVNMMTRLFFHYIEHPERLGQKARGRIERDGLWRAACDYVSGMTDRFAIKEYMKYGLDTESAIRHQYSVMSWIDNNEPFKGERPT